MLLCLLDFNEVPGDKRQVTRGNVKWLDYLKHPYRRKERTKDYKPSL
ncbi:hypothetical protein Nhal_2816 [Nitrosococcus halophilus Nc 4]|uniref:Uncharacterized protein n=1 Tax=Nitrosococcus halophilus (strain Nc4) TaxID=472759 RepID=D5BXX0_NITHN|nr:hypothetical protein Nhal_2816 [Nitrosococcus halophilus Nc 4]